jgi:ferritin-like metal-binding protein YciE
MKLELMEDFYLEQLRDLADAEKQLLAVLPKMAEAAISPELKHAFELHAKQTAEQLKRLEKIFKGRNENAGGKRCKAMQGLIEEAQEFLEEDVAEELIDVGLVTAAQKVEHYEIASYGCVNAFARLLQIEDEAALLHQTLQEEKETDGKLTTLAESFLNEEAAQGEIPGEEVDDDSGNELNQEGRPAQGSSGKSKTSKQAAGAAAAKERHSRSTEPRSKRQHRQDGEGEAQSTTDLEEIRRWVESRGGTPAHVTRTGSKNDPGLLRIDFPGYSGEGTLEPISWDEWYKKFKDNNLSFLYQEKTKDGKESRFFKLVCNS